MSKGWPILCPALAWLACAGLACGGRSGPAAVTPGAVAPAGAEATLAPVGPDVALLSPEGSVLVLRRSALADQWFWLRAKAIEGEAPPGFEAARGAMLELRAALAADPTAWEDLEVPLGTAEGARDLERAFGYLPKVREVGDATVPLRAAALAVARELVATESRFRVGPYRQHAADIDRAARELVAQLAPRGAELGRAMREDMATPEPVAPIVLTLVADAPYTGAFAADDRGREASVFLRVRGLSGAELVETALHQSLHALDELTVRAPTTTMNALRRALAARGLDESDPNLEMIVNTVTFAEAASLVRRFVDPAHEPLGDRGFYALYPPARAVVAAWDRHLAGEPIEATAEALARAVNAP